jgi:hypothetical protein
VDTHTVPAGATADKVGPPETAMLLEDADTLISVPAPAPVPAVVPLVALLFFARNPSASLDVSHIFDSLLRTVSLPSVDRVDDALPAPAPAVGGDGCSVVSATQLGRSKRV